MVDWEVESESEEELSSSSESDVSAKARDTVEAEAGERGRRLDAASEEPGEVGRGVAGEVLPSERAVAACARDSA